MTTGKKQLNFLILLVLFGGVFFAYDYLVSSLFFEDDKTLTVFQLPADFLGSSYVVYDQRDDHVIAGLNENDQFALASLTKLMSAIIALEILPTDYIVEMKQDEIDTLIFEDKEYLDVVLWQGERWLARDLVRHSLTASYNGGMAMLAAAVGELLASEENISYHRELFAELMNKKAKLLGLKSFVFFNESGLDLSSGIGGAYGSAVDVAKIFSFAIKNYPETFSYTKLTESEIFSVGGEERLAYNTNYKVSSFPGIISSKTGLTDLAGGNLAIAFDVDLGHPVIIVVLGSTEEGRIEDALKLASSTVNYFYKKYTE